MCNTPSYLSIYLSIFFLSMCVCLSVIVPHVKNTTSKQLPWDVTHLSRGTPPYPVGHSWSTPCSVANPGCPKNPRMVMFKFALYGSHYSTWTFGRKTTTTQKKHVGHFHPKLQVTPQSWRIRPQVVIVFHVWLLKYVGLDLDLSMMISRISSSSSRKGILFKLPGGTGGMYAISEGADMSWYLLCGLEIGESFEIERTEKTE